MLKLLKNDKNIVILIIFMIEVRNVIMTLCPYKIYSKIKKRGEYMANKIIEVQNVKVSIADMNDNDCICISDFTKFKEGKS